MVSARTAARTSSVVVAALLLLSLALGLAPGVAQAAPRNPSDAEIAAAQGAREVAAAQVSALSGELSDAQAQVDGAQAASAIALDDYQAKQAQLDAARVTAEQTAAAATQAAADLQVAQRQIAAFARSSYMQGSTYPGAASLISADGPAQLIERAALLESAGVHRGDVVVTVTAVRARTVAAESVARGALAQADGLQRQAAESLAVAQTAERSAREQAAALVLLQADLEAQLGAAQAVLAELEGARSANEQATAVSAPAPPVSAPAPVPTPGNGSASAAQAAIDAAMDNLGTPYAWGGGGSGGPGYGIPPDEGVYGFDCSGLTQYAYARAGIGIPRNSRAQYTALTKVPSDDLQAGDLVFWATSPSQPSTIYHVALYLGNGTVVQAPESGDVVKVTSMWWSGYAGAVRPSA